MYTCMKSSITEINCHEQGLTGVFFNISMCQQPEQLKITNVSLYSMTPWKEAQMISRYILQHYQKKGQKHIVVTDACANVGGNTINFYLEGFQAVNAVEIDPLTCNLLKRNLMAYDLPSDHVYCDDYLNVYRQLKQDVVFLDPPWGGTSYRKHKNLDLFIGSKNIIDICRDLLTEKKVSLIVLKVPINYNLPSLINQLPNHQFVIHKMYRGYKRHCYNVVLCFY